MKNNKNLVRFLILLSLLIIAILIYRIVSIYAIFQSNVGANVKFKNGIWNINVNGTRVSTGVQADFVIDNIIVTEDEHTMPGKISPGLAGKFRIVINPENTNVSIKYDITLNQKELENSCVKIASIKEVENGAELIKTAENVYTGIINLQDIQKGVKHEIDIDIEWLDDGLNDDTDTELGSKKEDRQFRIPITFHAVQYLGEEIIPVT